jgi:hypothetical protein
MSERAAPGPHSRSFRLEAEAALILAAARVSLALLPFRVVMKLQGGLCARRLRPTGAPPDVVLERVVEAVARASRYVPGARCLPQALVGQVMLERRGVPAQLRFGVHRGETLQAHAWLVACGRPVLTGGPLDPYTRLTGPAEAEASEGASGRPRIADSDRAPL